MYWCDTAENCLASQQLYLIEVVVTLSTDLRQFLGFVVCKFSSDPGYCRKQNHTVWSFTVPEVAVATKVREEKVNFRFPQFTRIQLKSFQVHMGQRLRGDNLLLTSIFQIEEGIQFHQSMVSMPVVAL